MFCARIKIMWEEQLVDPTVDYIDYVEGQLIDPPIEYITSVNAL